MDTEHLSKIDRIRIPESRDFINGFLMNRNERVVPWPKEVIDQVIKTIHPNEWNMYHYVQSLYKFLLLNIVYYFFNSLYFMFNDLIHGQYIKLPFYL